MEQREDALSVAEVVALEQRLAAEGTPLSELMARAGKAVADEVRLRASAPVPVVILAGTGNNGGDGWVCAMDLARDGYKVTLCTPRAAKDLTAEPARSAALEVMEALEAAGRALALEEGTVGAKDVAEAENGSGAGGATGLPLRVLIAPTEPETEAALSSAQVIVDAQLGTGFTGASMREPLASWTRGANARRATGACVTVAVDVPSGLSADTGSAASPTFEADVTVTMIARKRGLVAEGATAYTGTVKLAPLVDGKVVAG